MRTDSLCTLTSLPAELLEIIFICLEDIPTVSKVVRTCQFFRTLWEQRLYCEAETIHPGGPLFWAVQHSCLGTVDKWMKYVGPDSTNYGRMINDALIFSAIKTCAPILIHLICNGADPNYSGTRYTPLSEALRHQIYHREASRDLINIMSVLLLNGADPYGMNHRKTTPVYWACSKGNPDVVKLLELYGVDLTGTAWGWDGSHSIMHMLAAQGHHEALHMVLSRLPRVPNLPDTIKAIEKASRSGHARAVQLITEHFDLNLASPQFFDAFLFALARSRTSVVHYFLQQGVNPNVRMYSSGIPILAFIIRVFVRVHLGALKLLVQWGMNLNAQDFAISETALHAAARMGNVRAAQLLLQAGVDTSLVNVYGQTPLLLAIETGRDDMVQLLCEECPGMVNTEDMFGDTPLSRVVQLGENSNSDRMEIMAEILLKAGSSSKDGFLHDGASLLGVAAFSNDGILRVLLAAGANPNIRDLIGSTPLHYAAESVSLKRFMTLISYGADPEATNADGISPLGGDLGFDPDLAAFKPALARFRQIRPGRGLRKAQLEQNYSTAWGLETFF